MKAENLNSSHFVLDPKVTAEMCIRDRYGSASSVDALTQGGYASGSLTGLSVGSDGIVQGRYSNGQARNLGQVALATFANPNGLSCV